MSGRVPSSGSDAVAPGRLALAAAWAGGMVLVGAYLTHRSLAMAEEAAVGDTAHFAVFWVAMALGLLPLLAFAVARSTSPLGRWVAVAAAGVFTTLPKLWRNGGGPLYSDEFGHLYQTRRVLHGGLRALDEENPLLRVAPDFPLLHWITAGVHSLGVDLWTAASSVAAVAHVVTLLAVFALVRVVSGNGRLAAIGAFVYLLQPGWLFFSAQFAYETIGLPLLVLTLTAALAARLHPPGSMRTALLAATVVGAAATALAHHFAAVTLAGLLVATVLFGWRGREERLPVRRPDVVVTAVAVAVIAAWVSFRMGDLWPYYRPTVMSGLDRLREPFSEGGSRTVFSGSPAPVYERWAGIALPFVLAGLSLGAFLLARAQVWGRRVTSVFTLLAASFFVSMPLVLTVAGAEAAHRWWAYAYLGFAVLFALAFDPLSATLVALRSRAAAALKVALVAAFVVVAVGGVAAGTSVAYRFPGPTEVGGDARSVSPEARAMAEWLLTNAGPGAESAERVLADRYTAQQIVGWGEQITSRPSPGYPAWDLLFSADPQELAAVAPMLSADRVAWVVVDARMTTDRPSLGYWFNRTEPGAFGTELVPAEALDKFACATWAQVAHREGFLTLYRVDTAALGAVAAGGRVCP